MNFDLSKTQKIIIFIVLIISPLFPNSYTTPHMTYKSLMIIFIFSTLLPLLIFKFFDLRFKKIGFFKSYFNLLTFMSLLMIAQGITRFFKMIFLKEEFFLDPLFTVSGGFGILFGALVLKKIKFYLKNE